MTSLEHFFFLTVNNTLSFLMIRFKMIITLTMHVTVNVNNRLKEEIFLGQSRCCAIAILT